MSGSPFAAFWASSRGRLTTAGVTALVLVVVVSVVLQPFFGVRPVYAQDQFTLTPETSDAAGVEADTSYILESKSPVKASDIESMMTAFTSEDVTLEVEQISDTKLRVQFSEPLQPEEVVKFSLATQVEDSSGAIVPRIYNWAYQVKGDFRVTSSIPGDRTAGVPLDSGFEFLFNYENIDPEAFEAALTISPATEGHIEHSRRSFVFVPDDLLQPATVYTATLSGDLLLEGSDETLGEDYVITFETSVDTERGSEFYIGQRFHTITPDSTLAIPYYTWTWNDDAGDAALPIHMNLFRFDTFDAYVDALQRAQMDGWRQYLTASDLIDTSATPALSFDAERTEYDYTTYLVSPDSIPAGYYVADIEYKGEHRWAMIASSNLTAYVSRATDQTLVWVNDAATDLSVSGASVAYTDDTNSAQTNAQGLASVPSKIDQTNVVEVRHGLEAVAIVLDNVYVLASGKASWDEYRSGSESYWNYLYTDRPTYRPTDTVFFWGYAEKRSDGSRPSRVCAEIAIAESCVEVMPGGTYTGSFELQNAPIGYFSLEIKEEGTDTVLSTRSLNVAQYVKPAFTLSLSTDVDAAYVEEEIGFTVHGEYFEGTPVKGMEVRVSGECVDQILTLDDAGNARGQFRCTYNDGASYPNSSYLSVRPNRPEEGMIEANTNFLLFGPKVYLHTDWEASRVIEGTGTARLTVRNTQAIDSYDPLVFGPTVRSGQTVTGKVYEIYYTRVETGTSYDFVRKLVVKNYDYTRHEDLVAEFTAVSDANGVVTYQFPAGRADANYRVEVAATDEIGRTDRKELYVGDYPYVHYGAEDLSLSFVNDDADGPDDYSFAGYDVGEQVHLSVHQQGKRFTPDSNGKFLFYQAHQGIQETFVTSESAYTFPYESRDVPNVGIYGVYYANDLYQFVGGYGWWWGSSGYSISYDTSNAKLNVELTPDKQEYAPGSEANIVVRVTDKDGNPVSTEVNVNVVDEAYYAVYPETVNPLDGLYAWVDDGVLITEVTRELATAAMGAEKGGGGDRSLGRFTFKDTAAFVLVQTDGQGNGAAAFTLPDNITSWRVTAQALQTDRKMAGHAVTNIDASLPFFIDAVMRESYLDDDEPIVIARVAGDEIGLGDTVEYTVQIKDAGYEEKTVKRADESLFIELPDLELGPHLVTIAASTGSFTDKLTRTVTIVPSRLVTPVIDSDSFSGSGSVSGADDRYTFVTFLDGNSGRYYPELSQLSWTWGDRADEVVTRKVALELLNETFGEENEIPTFSPESYSDGWVKLLPYASGDLELSARMALLGDQSPFPNLAGMFEDRLNQTHVSPLTPRESMQALAALAALDQPVLGELQRAEAVVGDDLDAKLWYAMGLHMAGDSEGARVVYRELLDQTTERAGYRYLEADDQATSSERTSLLAILAAGLNEPEAENLHEYMVEQREGETTIVLDRLLYVKEALPHLPTSSVSLSYSLRGEREQVTLEKGSAVSILVSPEERDALDLESDGVVMTVSRYETAAMDPNAPVDNSIDVTRSYSAEGVEGTTFNAGDLIRIKLYPSLPASNCGGEGGVPCTGYEVTDVLPSGLSAVTPMYNPYNWYDSGRTCYDWPFWIEDQRVSFWVHPNWQSNSCGDGSLTYYARVVTPGEYEAEPVYIRSAKDPKVNNHSDAATITITP